MPTDWTNCPAVRSRPGYLSGKPALRDDPRVSPETVVENLEAGETPQEVIENFGLRTPLKDILSIRDYALAQRAHPV